MRALISGSYTVKDKRAAKEIMKKLDGTFEPEIEQKEQVNKKIWMAKLRAFFK